MCWFPYDRPFSALKCCARSPASERAKATVSIGYAIGPALTFDEFGMWLHLGGGYWQRASFDAIIVLATLLGLLAFVPPPRSWRPRNIATALVTVAVVSVFYFMLSESFRFAADVAPRMEKLEQHAPL